MRFPLWVDLMILVLIIVAVFMMATKKGRFTRTFPSSVPSETITEFRGLDCYLVEASRARFVGFTGSKLLVLQGTSEGI